MKDFKTRQNKFTQNLGVALGLVLATSYVSFGDHPRTSRPPSIEPALQVASSETGLASYYGEKYHGKPTASGEIFNMNDLTAAHPKLAFGTRVKVTHIESSRSVTVRINDRGPFVQGRIIDLSKAAAAELQMTQSGLAQVRIEILK